MPGKPVHVQCRQQNKPPFLQAGNGIEKLQPSASGTTRVCHHNNAEHDWLDHTCAIINMYCTANKF
jgi:hypothetical protein